MNSSSGPKSGGALARRMRLALALPIGAILVLTTVSADAQYYSRDGGGKQTRWRGGHGHGGGGGAAVAGGLIGLGVGLAAGAAANERRRVREETVIEEYEVRPARRANKARRAPVEVVEQDGYHEPPRRWRDRREVEAMDVEEFDEPRPARKRPPAKPKTKVVRAAPGDAPVKGKRPGDVKPVVPALATPPAAPPPTETARVSPPPPPATPPAAPLVPPPPQNVPAIAASGGPDRVPEEVLIEVARGLSDAEVDALAARQRLNRIESHQLELTGTTVFRWRIPDGRDIDQVVDALRADPSVLSAQPNHIFELSEAIPEDLAASQYAVAKMRLDEALEKATGKGVSIAVIDSAVDPNHPALKGAVVEIFDPIGGEAKPDAHGTAVAGLAAGRGGLASPAPGSEIYAVRAFAPERKAKAGAQGTTMLILRGLDWASSRGVRVVNMSFAGPKDAKIAEAIAAGAAKGAIYIAAAGNAGPSSPPLYPAADPNVIAVTATDAEDRILSLANRGDHVSVAAPGVEVLVATPGGGFGFLSGTSMASAEVAGLVAMMAEAQPGMPAWRARAALTGSARDLGAPGKDPEFGAGAVDAVGALGALGIETSPPVAGVEPPDRTASSRSASASPASLSDSDVPPVVEAP